MFTGLIQALGKVIASTPAPPVLNENLRLTVQSDLFITRTWQIGDSVAINGVCLTIVSQDTDKITVELSPETLRLTTFVNVSLGQAVNLEPALTLQTALGGHLVTGHIDGLGSIRRIERQGDCFAVEFITPSVLLPYLSVKGSITVDGVSLTVNAVSANSFTVMIIPHTWDKTIFQFYQKDQKVNLEVDVIARYVARLLAAQGLLPGAL
jgi:riboflavin synthase